MFHSSIRTVALGAVLTGAAIAAQAATIIDFSTSTVSMTGIGADNSPGTNPSYDKLSFTGVNHTGFDVTAPVDADIGVIKFETGFSCSSASTCGIGPYVTPPIDFTVNGVTKQFAYPFYWNATATADEVTFSQPAPLTFDLAGGAKLNVSFYTPAKMTDLTGPIQLQTASAHFTVTPVPEPETYALLLAGMGVVGLALRRKQRA
ncbi:MAG: PEP-CTERM sorting domain-containing protein [Burkholderiales bacterium]|nr:PEP-CTERM sorting domain-containing protein [Burkholderiales bacterium]MDE2432902.1 PEP-CTERM sorting domain-containing protein [Burkholderiales bacterium]